MKKYLTRLAGIIMAGCVLFSSCEKVEEESAEPASVTVKVESVTASSVTFTVTPVNAVSISYVCEAEGSSENPEFRTVETSEAKTITEKGLAPETNYTLKVLATNADGKMSEFATETFTTTGLDECSINVNIDEIGYKSVKFTITPTDAASYRFALCEKSEQPLWLEVYNGNTETYQADTLQPLTDYRILAVAKHSNGTESQMIEKVFTTTEIPGLVKSMVIAAETNSAEITFEQEGAEQIHYAVVEGKDAERPEESQFTTVEATEKYVVANVQDLKADTDYTVWAYAENISDAIKENFRTKAETNKGFKVTVTSITKDNATIEVEFDNTMYGAYYLYTDLTENIAWGFEWQSSLVFSYYGTESATVDLATVFGMPLTSSSNYTLKAIAMDLTEDNFMYDTEITEEIQLTIPTLGESNVSAEIVVGEAGSSSINYTINTTDASKYYFKHVKTEDMPADLEDYILKNVVSGTPKTDFGTEKTVSYLSENTSYTLICVPEDAEGKLGNYVTKEVSTIELALDGNGTVTVENLTSTPNTISATVNFGENTKEAKYLVFTKGLYQTDEDIWRAVINSYSSKSVYATGTTVTAYNLSEESDYVFAIVAKDNDGKWGGFQKFDISTTGFVVDGNATVTLSTPTFKASGNYGMATFTITPDSNCQKYYYGYLASYNVEGKTDAEIAKSMMSKEEGSGIKEIVDMFVTKGSYIVVLPVDNEGRFCKPVTVKCPDSFE